MRAGAFRLSCDGLKAYIKERQAVTVHEFPVFTYEQVAALTEIMEKGDSLVVNSAVAVTVVREGRGDSYHWNQLAQDWRR